MPAKATHPAQAPDGGAAARFGIGGHGAIAPLVGDAANLAPPRATCGSPGPGDPRSPRAPATLRGMTAVSGAAPRPDMAWVPGGTFAMGDDALLPGGAAGPRRRRRRVLDGRAPGHRRRVPPLREGDRPRHGGRAGARGGRLSRRRPGEARSRARSSSAPPRAPSRWTTNKRWWAWVPGACWRRPEGPGSDTYTRARHPVVHIAHADALAYAEWAGKAPAHRGGVGARGARRARRRRLRVGRRAGTGQGQHLAGRVPVARLPRHLARSAPSRPTASASTT